MEWYSGKNIRDIGSPFNIIIGGRGIGKTFDFLADSYENHKKTGARFIYLRTQQSEIDACISAEGNPYKAVNEKKNTEIDVDKAGKLCIIKDKEGIIAYGVALTTFGNMRGMDFSDVNEIIYEEFNTVSRNRVKNKFMLFFNLYETVNRNRELEGKAPVKVYMLSNSTSLDNEILAELDIIQQIEKMMKKGTEIWTSEDNLISVQLVGDLEVSREKSKTVAYRLTRNTSFYKQAIENEFTEDSWFNVKRKPLQEYRPVVMIDGITIYVHKSNGTYYACMIKAECPAYSSKDNKAFFIRAFGIRLIEIMYSGQMFYSDYTTKLKLLAILN